MRFRRNRFVKKAIKLIAVCSILLIITTIYNNSLRMSNQNILKASFISTKTIRQQTTISMAQQIKNAKIDLIKNDVNDSSLAEVSNLPGNFVENMSMISSDICNSSQDVDLVIIVHTAPANLDRRDRIRRSFANNSLFLHHQVRIAFLLGYPRDIDLKVKILQEYNIYQDSVIGNFIDDYHNLTIKGVMGFRWISEHCSKARLVLKIDDDILVNTYKILYSLTNHVRGKSKSIFCNVWLVGTMPILRTGKWKMESHIFSKQGFFPYNYCSGFCVLLTTDLIVPLYQASKISPYIWIDDIYLFGMLPYVVGGVTFYQHGFDKSLTKNDKKFEKCTVTLGSRCLLIATYTTPEHYWQLWRKVKEIYEATIWNMDKIFVL